MTCLIRLYTYNTMLLMVAIDALLAHSELSLEIPTVMPNVYYGSIIDASMNSTHQIYSCTSSHVQDMVQDQDFPTCTTS